MINLLPVIKLQVADLITSWRASVERRVCFFYHPPSSTLVIKLTVLLSRFSHLTPHKQQKIWNQIEEIFMGLQSWNNLRFQIKGLCRNFRHLIDPSSIIFSFACSLLLASKRIITMSSLTLCKLQDGAKWMGLFRAMINCPNNYTLKRRRCDEKSPLSSHLPIICLHLGWNFPLRRGSWVKRLAIKRSNNEVGDTGSQVEWLTLWLNLNAKNLLNLLCN